MQREERRGSVQCITSKQERQAGFPGEGTLALLSGITQEYKVSLQLDTTANEESQKLSPWISTDTFLRSSDKDTA